MIWKVSWGDFQFSGFPVHNHNQVMDSGPMQLAMIISAITFTQTSILNYTYFLNNVFRSRTFNTKVSFYW